MGTTLSKHTISPSPHRKQQEWGWSSHCKHFQFHNETSNPQRRGSPSVEAQNQLRGFSSDEGVGTDPTNPEDTHGRPSDVFAVAKVNLMPSLESELSLIRSPLAANTFHDGIHDVSSLDVSVECASLAGDSTPSSPPSDVGLMILISPPIASMDGDDNDGKNNDITKRDDVEQSLNNRDKEIRSRWSGEAINECSWFLCYIFWIREELWKQIKTIDTDGRDCLPWIDYYNQFELALQTWLLWEPIDAILKYGEVDIIFSAIKDRLCTEREIGPKLVDAFELGQADASIVTIKTIPRPDLWRRNCALLWGELNRLLDNSDLLVDFKPDQHVLQNIYRRLPDEAYDLASKTSAFGYPISREKRLTEIDPGLCSHRSSLRYLLAINRSKVYPFTIYAIQKEFALARVRGNRSEDDEAFREFNFIVEKCSSWNPVEALLKYSDVDKVIRPLIPMPGKCHSGNGFDSQVTLEQDREDMSQLVENIMRNGSTTWNEVLVLPCGDLLAVIDLLQNLIDSDCTNHQLLERKLKRLMMNTKTLPPSLIVTQASCISINPVAGGGFADVYKGRANGALVALKALRLQAEQDNGIQLDGEFREEAMKWSSLRHENICPFLGIVQTLFEPRIALLSPWFEQGDMRTYLRKNRHVETDRTKLIRGVALGLCYMHQFKPPLVHGDLKSKNVLINDQGIPQITDFGLAIVIDSQDTSRGIPSFKGEGLIKWQAPELLKKSQYGCGEGNLTVKSDVYAYACVCWEIFTGDIPWGDLMDGRVLREVCDYDKRPPRPLELSAAKRGLTDAMWELMQDCWKTEPNDRPEMTSVIDRLLPGYAWEEEMKARNRLIRPRSSHSSSHLLFNLKYE